MMRKVGGDCTPSHVLLCENQQVGAMDGPLGLIVTFKIFDPYQGVRHSEIFLELLEQMARSKGLKRIETSSVSEPRMIRALKRCEYILDKDDCYHKDF